MKKILLTCSMFQLLVLCVAAQVKLQQLRTENLTNPVGLGISQPRFSWQLISPKRNTMQSAYEIAVAEGNTAVWKSGKVISDSSVQVIYKGASLKSGTKYNWKIRVWDNTNKPSPWSETASSV